MNATSSLQLSLDDLLADLRHARRVNDLGRLALIAYCEVRRWARNAGELELAEQAGDLVTGSPHASRAVFVEQVDHLIEALEQLRPSLPEPASTLISPRPWTTRPSAAR